MSKQQTTTGKTDNAQKTEQASIAPKDATERRRINIKMVQNVLLIWLDKNIDEEHNSDCQNTVAQLRRVVNRVNTFTDGQECIQFLKTNNKEKVCMIISGSLGEHIVPCIHNMSEVDSIFIFCGNKKNHEQWAKEWSKIRGVFTEITPICTALKEAAKQCEQNLISISIMNTSGNISNTKLDQLDPTFMYTQIFKEILLSIKFEKKHFKEFINYCEDAFVDNKQELINVKELEQNYGNKTPIWWYTCESFLYPMLNRGLRVMDGDIMIKMGFFINNSHQQIHQLHEEQFDHHPHLNARTFTFYRGQGLFKTDFNQLINNKGDLMSFNNFLSTSKDRKISLPFAYNALSNPDMVGILFVMTINPSIPSTPFASIKGISYFPEEDEMLFSMHTVFRIVDIKQLGNNPRLFQVDLSLVSDNDKDRRILTDRIRQDTEESTGWARLGLLLRKIGQPKKAQEIYEDLLEQTTDERGKGNIYKELVWIKYMQGEYQEAIAFYKKSFKIYKKILPSNHPDLGQLYNNIGAVYYGMGEHSKALSYYENALEIRQQSLPANHPKLAASHNNIGAVYSNMGEYSKALSSHEKALEIRQQLLPANHPDLAASYGNIGAVYSNMGEYSKALSSHEKVLEIRQQSLPANHTDLAMSYNNIGLLYYNMGEYLKALSSHEKALEIREQSLSANHPNFATSYNNIGLVYYNMGEYSKALSSHEKALEIRQQSFPANHPDLASPYNNIGLVYYNMGEYSKALSSHEKVLQIREQSLPANHPDLAMSYNNIGLVYYNMGEYSKALSYYEKALEIDKKSLPANHPDLASDYNNIGLLYKNMGEYSKALSSHEKALEIRQQSLPTNHPNLAASYNNIGLVYSNMGEYSKALSSHEKALEIREQSLSANHPVLAASYNNLSDAYKNMGEYSKALLYFEKVLEIQQQSFPLNHPNLASTYNNIGVVYCGMGEYSKAHSCFKRAMNIGEHSLPSSHPDLQGYRENLDIVKKKL